MIRYKTSGESHGEKLVGIISGIPANLKLNEKYINNELKRRQVGFGRSERMEIESDKINILSGVKENHTTGNPISITIENKGRNIPLPEVIKPRPGHGDLVGAIKYNQIGGRNILERASARETAMRVAVGSICKLLLKEFNIEILSHVISIGKIESNINYYTNLSIDSLDLAEDSDIRVIDKKAERLMHEEIQKAQVDGDSLGGKIEIIVRNLPIGFGSHINWDEKLDAKLAYSLMSVQGIKSVEIGLGVESAKKPGSIFQDEIIYDNELGYSRTSNYAGGIEAGISNGEDLVLRTVMKPIPTLKKGNRTVNMKTKKSSYTNYERSDVCAVPSASVVCESVVAYVLADELIKITGGNFMEEVTERFNSYIDYIKKR